MENVKFAKLDSQVLDKYREVYAERAAISRAIGKAEKLGLSNSEMQPLIVHKAKGMQEFIEAENDIVYDAINTNLVNFGDNWYGIICCRQNGKGYDLYYSPFLSNTPFEQIFINTGIDKLKSRKEYEAFFKQYVDKEALNAYNLIVGKEANKYLKDCYEFTTMITLDNNEYMLTEHIVARWQQRIQQCRKKKITLQRREDIVAEITSVFQASVYVYISLQDSTRFFLNYDEGIFFAVTPDDTIVTVWISTYGFACDEINKQITKMQLQYLQELQNEIIPQKNKELDDKINSLIKQKNDMVSPNYTVQIEELQNQIQLLNQQISHLEELQQQDYEVINKIDDEIKNLQNEKKNNCDFILKQEDVIFKSHAMIGGGEDANK